MEEQSLYLDVKKQLCRMIYEGIYADGDIIPPERKLAKELSVSRVTVRKALKLLEEEHIIERVQGSGTKVAMEYGARAGNMDIITLVAPAQNAFFSQFIDAVQTTADEMDSLVLFKQKPRHMSLEKCLYQIYEKDLRNVVLWLEDMEISQEELKRLRGLGMNLVLFDTTYKSMYADAVCLDNRKGLGELVQALKDQGCRRPGFVGWDEKRVRSVRDREESFLKFVPDGAVRRVSWEYRSCPEKIPVQEMDKILQDFSGCDGIIYSVSELGIPFQRRAQELGVSLPAAMVDALPGWEQWGEAVLEQDFGKMAEKIFNCLRKQNQEGSAWKAGVYRVKGRLLERS